MIRSRGLAASAVLLLVTAAVTLLAAAALTGCNSEEYVVAKIAPTQGNTATGEIRFYKVEGGVRVVGKLEGLSPGLHGFHLHEKGDCSAPDAMSAGGHYNPAATPHGAPDADSAHRHGGDLGNLEAGADGKAPVDRMDRVLVYENLVGLAVLVHANPDDLTSQPAGNAGPRVGCGVIARR